MKQRIQEARSKKEALEVTLNKCVAEHNLEVQQLCAAMEQQIQQEQQRMEQESMARSHLHGMELQRALDASEREVQRLVAAQVELETRCHSLRSMQQSASTEKQQLEENNRVLEEQLQHINLQLQQTHGCLWTTWAAVAQEHMEELQDRAAAELPGETPPSLQMSPEQSEKYCSEMQIQLGSQAGKPQRKNTHQVVWEKLPAETSNSGLPRALSVEEDPFPEFLKEEQFSDQGSLLREMNDAIAALSKQLKPQAPAAPTTLAEAACCLQDYAEPQTGPEAAALHGSATGAPQDTHIGHKLFKEDLREGRTAAELPARDMTQAGASTEELGAEQGNSLEGAGQDLEEVQGTLFGKGKGADEKEQMLKEAECPQGAFRESTETAERAWVEVEGAERVHKKTEQVKAQPSGDAEEAVLSQGENLEAIPKGWELELAPGWGLARDVLEVPGGCLELELICRGEVQMAAKQEDSVLPGVTTVPNPKNVDGEGDGAEVQSWGQDKRTVQVGADPAQVHGAKHGRSRGAACELPAEAAEEERGAGEAMQGWQGDAGLQPSGEDFGDRKEGTAHAHVLQLEAVPQAETQEGAVVADVQQLEALSNAASVQLLAELGELEASLGGSPEAELQHRSVAGAPGIEQAESMGPDVQPLEEAGRAEPGLEERTSAAAVLGEGLSPAETPVGSQVPDGLVQDNAQELKLKEAESFEQVEEFLSTPGGSTWAYLQPLVATGTGEVAQSQAVALEAGLCTTHNTNAWDGDTVAALHPEYASAAEHPYPDVILVALNDPDEQVLEENQALEIFQEESADAKRRPLDGAQGLEVVQGARLGAEPRILVEVQHLELKQGHDTNAVILASPVSEVPLQISTLSCDTVMQEDVLIPDVQWLGGSGQATQSEFLEQVSSQTDKVRLPAAPQQPQEKPPCVTETKQVAAGPSEPPKQEVPPVSAFCTRVQEEEDTGNDLLGMNLRDSTLVDAANSRVQPQRHLSGEWREDLDVGQTEKKKEIGQIMSHEGEPSPGEPGAMIVNGAGASLRGSSEVSLDPDHLYNVLFVGDSHVGKTSFLYRLHANTFNPHLSATVGLDYQVKSLIVDNKHFALRLWDSAGQERYHSITKQFFRKADGVVLMYDITSQYSFADVRYWLSCIQEGAEGGVTILLLGNKTDCATERQVPTQEAERLAEEYQLIFYECSAASGHNVAESMVSLIRSLKVREDQLRNKAEEVPKLPQKKKGCC
ncbi:ras-related protein Rab-44 isoform X2 [Oxyura jamaicensis]|nr:ras-related protein Rab-44 isoform X2 [Oxyura jamaicensis]XP_035203246.1 ras-related protein Rab-44 isoform X2 [Oxyura jamaicensis]